VQAPKKAWIKPSIEPMEIDQARTLIRDAIRLIEKDASLESACAELRSILQAIDTTQAD